jgi:hypothetical protein
MNLLYLLCILAICVSGSLCITRYEGTLDLAKRMRLRNEDTVRSQNNLDTQQKKFQRNANAFERKSNPQKAVEFREQAQDTGRMARRYQKLKENNRLTAQQINLIGQTDNSLQSEGFKAMHMAKGEDFLAKSQKYRARAARENQQSAYVRTMFIYF